MLELIAAILALAVGPVLDRFSDPRGPTRAALDAFTFLAMLGLILGHIIPDAYELAGPWSLLVAAAAWYGPTVLEHRVRSLAERAHLFALVLGALGLVMHGTFDGMALVDLSADEHDNSALSLAVILHRIPAGLTIWWLVAPRWGMNRALLVLLGLGATTIGGFAFASQLAGTITSGQVGYFQALVGGALLHVVIHRTGHGQVSVAPRRQRIGAACGTLLAILLLGWMFAAGEHIHAGIESNPHLHPENAVGMDHDHGGHHHDDDHDAGTDDHHGDDHVDHDHDGDGVPDHDEAGHDDEEEHRDGAPLDQDEVQPDPEHEENASAHRGHDHGSEGGFIDRFLRLGLASAPALVLAFLMAGLIQVFLPRQSVQWLSRGSRLGRAAKGMLFGLPLPICSCGVIPVFRSLVNRGVPTAAGLAFLVATPELGLDAVLLSVPLLGGKMAILRVIAAVIVALVVGALVSRLQKNTDSGEPIAEPEEAAEGNRLLRALRIGWGDFFDGTFPWILLGLIVAAVCEPLLNEDSFAAYSPWLQVPAFAVIGMPVYVCAAGATPLVAVFLMKGVTPGAALAFLLTGPATNVTTFGLLDRLHGRRLAIGFVAAVILTTVSIGLCVDLLLGDFVTASEIPKLHDHDPSLLSQICLAILGLALATSLYRQGPQGFASHVFAQAGDEGHDHDGGCHGDGDDEPASESCCH